MDDYGTRENADLATRNKAESVVERVYLSVKHLCTGKGDVRNRLVGAVTSLLLLQTHEFPEDLQSDFEWVIEKSTKYESEYQKYQGNIEATMKRIKNSTGDEKDKEFNG